MPGHVRQQQPADSTSGAAGRVVDIPARLRFSEGFAVNPYLESAEFDALRCELVSTPDFHALHVLFRLRAHGRIVPGLSILPRRDPSPPATCMSLGSEGTIFANMSDPHEVTVLLSALTRGDEDAGARLIPVVYDELRRLAGSYMRRERPDHTLQATALVHEAYLKLIEQQSVNWQTRAHFFGIAAQLMRRILIDHARGHLRQKRGGEYKKVSLNDAYIFSPEQSAELLAVEQSLQRLAKLDERQARVVELRFFGGLSVEEAAAVLGISPKTVKRDWSMAKAWLHAELKEHHGIDAGAMGDDQGSV